MKLIKNKEGLSVSEPIEPFETDCTHCKNFIFYKFSDAGKCKKHENISFCGWGCTCEDFEK